jgi:hypothetical protein
VKDAEWWRKKIEEHTKIAHTEIISNYVIFYITDRDIVAQAQIPYSVAGMRIHRNELDGSFSIARRHQAAEKFLDSIGIRVPNCLQWFLPYDGPRFDFTDRCYVVGKGPSLDSIKAEHFDGVSSVLCVNDSIHKIVGLGITNPLYMFQQDIGFKDKNILAGVISILAYRVKPFVGQRPDVHYIHPRAVGPNASVITGVYAMNTAMQMGIRSFKFMCFDACVVKRLGYAKCIAGRVEDGGRPERFLGHRQRIDDARGSSEIEWFIPTDLAYKVSDKPHQ